MASAHKQGLDQVFVLARHGRMVTLCKEEAFKAGLRERFGKVPTRGIPRLLPPRRKAGTATGFSIVDTGGNWLRFYREGSSEIESSEERRFGLGRAIDVAARQGDARGDDAQAIAVLDTALIRYPDAPAVEMFEALLYRAELKARIGENADDDLAAAALLVTAHDLGAEAQEALSAARQSAGS